MMAMTITHVITKSSGFEMPPRDVPNEPQNRSRFVSVREYVRGQPLHAPMVTIAAMREAQREKD